MHATSAESKDPCDVPGRQVVSSAEVREAPPPGQPDASTRPRSLQLADRRVKRPDAATSPPSPAAPYSSRPHSSGDHQRLLVQSCREQEALGPPLDPLKPSPVERERTGTKSQRGCRPPPSPRWEFFTSGSRLAAPGFDLRQLGQRRLPVRWTRSVTSRRSSKLHDILWRQADGESWAGLAFFRSTCKPMQAIRSSRATTSLGDGRSACASHRAGRQLDAVQGAAPQATSRCDDLEERLAGKLGHNCSGKHADALPRLAAPCNCTARSSAPVAERIAELIGGENSCDTSPPRSPARPSCTHRSASAVARAPRFIRAARPHIDHRPDVAAHWISQRAARKGSSHAHADRARVQGRGQARRPGASGGLGIEELAG